MTLPLRAALYLRVSTARHAEHDVSIPDQKRQGETYCQSRGYWNGSRPPIGYRVVAAEQRGVKVKKKLEIDPVHADTVRLIYRLALEGDGANGPMGVKAIASHLDQRRIVTRDGGLWGIGQIHCILTRTTYTGRHEFNKRSKSREQKPIGEIVTVEVPSLIDQATFDRVQAHLRSRNPKVMPARVVSGPTLLTGICFCANCGRAMTLRTGKGGRYRRDHLRAPAQRVEVADGEVRIMRSKGGLLRTLAAASGVKSAGGGVPSFVPNWRPGRDSNP